METQLHPGISHMQTLRIDDDLTVPKVSASFTGFLDMPKVFATAFMVGLIEWACVEALRPHLDPKLRTVGVKVDVTHLAATPPGVEVTARVELVAVAGRRLTFKVACWDNVELIGEGLHERVIIEPEAFTARAARKAA
jgi:fluoroacetyl-CoA thioesterase